MSNNNSNFINVVTDFGADNTGTNDTSQALINAFNSIATTGGTVFFPNGTYLIGKNTGKYVEFYSNTHIIGEANVILRFHPELAGTGQQALLRNHTVKTIGGYDCTKNCIIENIIFDNNADIQKKATTVGVGHAQNIIFKNCHWINGNGTSADHIHYIEFNACKNCKLIDCTFDKSKNSGGTNSEMVNIDCATKDSYGASSYYVYDSTKCDNIEIVGCKFYSFSKSELPSGYHMSPAIGGHSSTNHNAIIIHDCYFEGDWNSAEVDPRYVIEMYGNNYNCSVYDNTFVGNTDNVAVGIKIPSSKKNNFIYNNKFVNYKPDCFISPETKNKVVCYDNVCVKTATSEVIDDAKEDRRYKLLWNGSLVKGENCTVNGINDYSVFLVESAFSKATFLAKRDGASINGGGVYNNNNGETKVYTMSFHGSISDETLTLTFASRVVHNSSSNHSTIYPDSITAIYGVI